MASDSLSPFPLGDAEAAGEGALSLGALQRHHPRRFEDFTYAYAVISRRSGGVSIGVNLNLDKLCNFDCPYCQVDRKAPGRPQQLEIGTLVGEVEALVQACAPDGVCRLPRFAAVPEPQRILRDIALSGDGEPTLVPEFATIAAALADLQKRHIGLGFKLVLITNATLLDRPKILQGIDNLLHRRGEVWAKLDAGTEAHYQAINVSRVSLDRIEANLKILGQRHPFTVQSFFCRLAGERPSDAEIAAYLERLRRVRESGARIEGVQIYSLARTPAETKCTPLENEYLQAIAAGVQALGLTAKVYATAD